MNTLQNISRLVGKTFTLWAILFSALGLFAPDMFKWVLPMVPYLLGVIMFGMGLTLTPADFKILGTQPKPVA